MGLSTALLCLAVAAALVPAAWLRFRTPQGPRQLALAITLAAVTVAVAYRIVDRSYPLRLFENTHLSYLIVVVTAPLLLGIWFLSAVRRRSLTIPSVLSGIVAVLLAFGGIWGTHIEPNRLRVERIAIAADVSEPFTIGVLADLQTAEIGDLEWAAVTALIDNQPDIVLVPGDLYQGHLGEVQAELPKFIALLDALVAEVDVVAVVSGDHDASGLLPPIVEASGAMYLDNQTAELTVRGQTIRLAGVAVWPSEAKQVTIAQLSSPTDAFSILLSHRPGVTYALPTSSDVDLIVAGHTHGAQIQLPFVSDLIWYSDVPPIAANGGFSLLEDFPLYVSTGVGMERGAAPQVRFGVPPTVDIIEVRPRTSPPTEIPGLHPGFA